MTHEFTLKARAGPAALTCSVPASRTWSAWARS